ncbi:MAG: hypothetical protein ACTSRX_05850 [Promethearchaeota archaeon]
MAFFYIIDLDYFNKKMQGYAVFLIFIFIIGQILIIYFIRNKFAIKNQTGKINSNNIFEAERDLEEMKSKGILGFRRFMTRITGIGI